ncbi:MAG: DUF308 domain-containing protein [Bacteroidales bacterium]|nr:DUF308 domain-containing protein [Bacteroidales bacterium]
MSMFTVGYKDNFQCIFRSVLAIAVGLALIIVKDAPALLVQIVAAFVAFGGVASIVAAFASKADRKGGVAAGIGSLVIAALLFIFSSQISIALFYLIAFGLVLFGIMQLGTYTSILSFQGFGFFSIIMSGIIIAGGIVMLILLFGNAREIIRLLSILAGSFLLIYGIMDLINARTIRRNITDYYAAADKLQAADEQ